MKTKHTRTVLFVQGAGAGAHDADRRLVASLRDVLGSAYDVRYPRMPNEADPDFARWKTKVDSELGAFDVGVILVGHSAGGAMLLRYLAEGAEPKSIAGLFLLAPPFLGKGGWDAPGWDIAALVRQPIFASQVIEAVPVFLYHSRNDDVVPFEHSRLYKALLPRATLREYDRGGHQFDSDMSDVAQDVAGL